MYVVLFIKRPKTSLAWACHFSPQYTYFSPIPDSRRQLPLTAMLVAPQLQSQPAAAEQPSRFRLLLQCSWTQSYPAPTHFQQVPRFPVRNTSKQSAPTPSQQGQPRFSTLKIRFQTSPFFCPYYLKPDVTLTIILPLKMSKNPK